MVKKYPLLILFAVLLMAVLVIFLGPVHFSFQQKVLIIMVLLSLLMFGFLRFSSYKRSNFVYIPITISLVSILSWNYMYNAMNLYNIAFQNFQQDSEWLVSGAIAADETGATSTHSDYGSYGLAYFYDLKGKRDNYDQTYYSSANWDQGYERNGTRICIVSSDYSEFLLEKSDSVRFANGDVFKINGFELIRDYYVISLDSNEPLSFDKFGSLDCVRFLDSSSNPLPSYMISEYQSQYGLQGKLFRKLAKVIANDDMYSNMHLICSILTALVFTLIVIVLNKKYGLLMASCFYFVFLLSPWIVFFARNLYWVEFTWFIPMLVGLICSWKLEKAPIRISCYFFAAISIFLKCLCGYEYISVIMISLISFLLVDLIVSIRKANRSRIKMLIRSILIIGFCALAGFLFAICLHAQIKGEGNIAEGINRIIMNDALRRTYGADNDVNVLIQQESVNPSVWYVIFRYFSFTSAVVWGIPRFLFPFVCVAPILLMLFDLIKKKTIVEYSSLYFIFLLSTLSWFILAKNHSFVHQHMNYVLWYFGYVQICFYIIARWLIGIIKSQPLLHKPINNFKENVLKVVRGKVK